MNAISKMTPQEFWASVRELASARTAELKVNRLFGQNDQGELLANTGAQFATELS
ncbi:hypothetical protein ACVSDK_004842 [Escherichia coli]